MEQISIIIVHNNENVPYTLPRNHINCGLRFEVSLITSNHRFSAKTIVHQEMAPK